VAVRGTQHLGELQLAAQRFARVALRDALLGGRAVGYDDAERQVVGDDLPRRLRLEQATDQPGPLLRAEQAALRVGVGVAVVGVLVERMSSLKMSSSGP
jgi:hypothetical protein